MSTADATLRMILLGEDRSASKALGSVGSSAERTKGHFASLGKVAAGVFAGGTLIEGAQKAAEFLKGSVDAAMQDQQANAILARQLKNTTGATDAQIKSTQEWVTKTAEASGTAKSELTPALTQLATVTGSVTKARKLETLAMNVSAGTGKSLASVTAALVKAQNGSVGGLSRMGIQTQKTTKDTAAFSAAQTASKSAALAYTTAIKDHGAHSIQASIALDKLKAANDAVKTSMDATKKTTMSFTQIQGELAKKFKGDTAAAADTAAGKMKRLGVTWEEMKVQIGDKLLPVLADLAGFFLDKVMPAVSRLGSYLSTKLGPFFTQVAGIVQKTTGGMNGDVGENLGAIMDTFKSITDIIRTLWKDFGGFLLTYMGSTLKNVWHLIGGVLKIIEGIFKVFDSLIHGDWKGVWTGIKMILSGALTVIKALLKQGLTTLRLMWQVGWTILKAVLSKAWDGILALARLEVQLLLKLITGIPQGILKLGGLMISAGKHLITSFFSGIVQAGKNSAAFIGGIVTDIKHAINGALGLPIVLPRVNTHIPGVGTIGGETLIPALAKGGIVTRPTIAMIGEAGPEAVIPLGSSGFGGGDLGTFAVDLRLDGKTMQTVLLRLKRQNGNLALGLA